MVKKEQPDYIVEILSAIMAVLLIALFSAGTVGAIKLLLWVVAL